MARTINGTSGNDVIDEFVSEELTVFANQGDDYVWTGSGDDLIYGDNGNDTLKGWSGNDLILGGYGNDQLQGESGNDTLDGVDSRCNDVVVIPVDGDIGLTSSALCLAPNGQEQYDTLTGNAGADTFVLGSPSNAYYNNDGFGGYARITDFNWAEGDKFQVFGNSTDYTLTPFGGGMDIYYQGDLIAWVTNTTNVVLPDDFIFV